MQAIELYLDGVQIGEIGQEDVFSMEDFERELGCSGGMKEQAGRGILSNVADPYSQQKNHQSRGVTFQIEDEDDLMCPYEQTQASNYLNYDMKSK